MGNLTYLLDEICAGIEIYYTGRTGGQYLKTAYILCDDYAELASKLFLLTENPMWSDQKAGGGFKNYHDIQLDVQAVFNVKRAADLPVIQALHANMNTRRGRRNDFFHSTRLLDLSVTQRNCVDAFCDLMEYGELLFGVDWNTELCAIRNLETLAILLRLEKKSFSDPSIIPHINKILGDWPRNGNVAKIGDLPKKGVLLAFYPEDLHLRLCIVCGGKELKNRLAALL